MRVQLRRPGRKERGAVAITVAILMIPMSILLGFTVDIGNAMAQRQALSTSADSAALAVAGKERALAVQKPGQTCAQLVSADDALAVGSANKSTTIALAQINANSGFGPTVQPSDITTPILSCTALGVLQVTVSIKKSVSTTFAKLAGVSTLNIGRAAQADMGVPNVVNGWRPVGVCQYQAQTIIADAMASSGPPYPSEVIGMTKIWKDGSGSDVSCGTGGSGNWGWLDCGGKGVPVLAAAITSGCTNPITLDTSTTPPSFSIAGSPGNKGNAGPVKSAMNATLDQVIDLPVYSTFSGTGANATYTIIGFLSVQLCGYDTYHGICYDNDPLKSSAGDALQVRYAAYTPVGELGDNCGVGQIYCSNNSLVIKLVS